MAAPSLTQQRIFVCPQLLCSSEDSQPRAAQIVVRDGKIVALRDFDTPLPESPDVEIVQMREDCVVMPGLVDSHVHCNDPGRDHWEGFYTATRAAAAGGVTTIGDMPLNSIPPTTTVENLEAKRKATMGKLHVDVGFIGGAVHDNADDLPALVQEGVVGFKCFLIHSGVDEFTAVNEDQARLALKKLQGTGAFLMFHAEVCVSMPPSPAVGVSKDPTYYSTFLRSRPGSMEMRAIEMIIRLCEETGVHCHIVHLSEAGALPLIRDAKARGLPITVETCYHYLNFAAETIPNGKPQFKCCPPIRDKDNQELLWRGLIDGTIDMVVSDHSPSPPEMKVPDFIKAWGGISGLQTGLAVMTSQCAKRSIPVQNVLRWCCERPAELMGMQQQKGRLLFGMDADLIEFDPTARLEVSEDTLAYRHQHSAYVGLELTGVVQRTFLRGEQIFSRARGTEEWAEEVSGRMLARPQPVSADAAEPTKAAE